MKSSFGCVMAMAIFVILQTSTLWAAPFSRNFTFRQPDGTDIVLHGQGNEFYAEFETPDGYAVVFNPATKTYHYAKPSADGSELQPVGDPVGKADPTKLGINKHHRISATARKKQGEERFKRWDDAMGVSKRWAELKAMAQMAPGSGSGSGSGSISLASYPTTTGYKMGLTILVDFSDATNTIPQSDLISFCNGDNNTLYGNNGSVKSYYYDVSNGLLIYSNVVTVYIRAPQPKSYYNNTSLDAGTQGRLLANDAITAMKAMTNYTSQILPLFSNLTVDGSSDVMACNVLFAGADSGVWSYGLWPNSWSLSSAIDLGNGKKVYRYEITNIGTSPPLFTFCHENGHMLCGYPDIYPYTGSSSGGAGNWCLMDGRPNDQNPIQICAYLKRASGWATTLSIDSSSYIPGAALSATGAAFNTFYRYQKPGVSTEYYLLENRQKSWRDAYIPGGGILVWHIDELGDHSNPSTNYNTSHLNYEVSLMQADNLWQLQAGSNEGDANDPYYRGNTATSYTNAFTDYTAPCARWWDGTPSGLILSGFSTKSNTMTFTIGTPAVNLVLTNVTLTAESALPTNGVPDANETVTFQFAIQNTGYLNTSNLVVTLLATNGVTFPSAAQTYGIVTGGAAAVSRPFTFIATGTAGGTIQPTLQLQDVTTNYGTVSQTFTLGMIGPVWTQNFDSVTAPALPAGWTTSASGGESTWVTDTSQKDTSPNAAFSLDPSTVGSNQLVSTTFSITTTNAQLSFRNYYNTEGTYDGGVLEIKIGSGNWQDIITAGGSWITNGYTATLSSSYGNPYGGRQAWTGNSGGFITTIVKFPQSAAGQTVQLRWCFGSDSSNSGAGWWVDSITASDWVCASSGTGKDSLANLVPSTGTLSPPFAFNITSYVDSVSYATTNLTVTPTALDTNATITVNGSLVASGNPSSPYSLSIGSNTINTVVVSQDLSATNTYSLTVVRAAAKSTADLTNLTTSAGSIPSFVSNTFSYVITVLSSTTNLTVTPTAVDPFATITVNSNLVASGNASGLIPLIIGSNVITTVVVSDDFSKTNTYTLSVVRPASTNAYLANLVPSAGSLIPAFASNTLSYAVNVPNATTSLTMTPTVADTTATITVNGTPVTSGTPSGAISLNVGANIITNRVTAQDGITKVNYLVTVWRLNTAQSGIWTNSAGGMWDAMSNWTNGAAYGSGNTADFSRIDITADVAVNIDAPVTIGNLIFGDTSTNTAAGWTLANSTLTLAGTTPTITVNALGGAKNVTISNVVAGTSGLAKAGPGTLTLAAANTYAGGTTLFAGQLNINSATALGATGGTLTISGGTIDNTSGGALTLANNYPQNWNGDFTFAGSSALNMGSGLVTMGSSRLVTVNGSSLTVGVISGSGSLTKAGTGTLILGGGTSTYTGATVVTAGTVKLVNVAYRYYRFNVLKTKNGDLAGSSGSVQADELQFFLSGVWTPAVSASSPGCGGWSDGDPSHANDNNLTTKWGGNGIYPLIYDFGTPMQFDQYNWATGNDTESRDPVRWTVDGSNDGSTWTTLDDKSGADQTITSTRNAWTGNSNANNRVQGWALAGSVSSSLPSSTTLSVAGSGIFDLNGVTQTVASVSDSGGGGGNITNSSVNPAMLTINSSSGTNTFSGVIGGGSGTMSLVKSGAGVQVLSGANTYTGGTTVTGGVLLVHNTLASGVSVTSGGTLGGTGTVAGVVTVNAGGNLSPIPALGTLTVTTNVTISSGASLTVAINDTVPPYCSQLAVSNALTITGATLNITTNGTAVRAAYVIGTYNSLTGTFSVVNGLPSGYMINYAYNSGKAIAIVPAGVPLTPTGLTASGSNAVVTLGWNSATGAASYNLKRATVNGGPYTTIQNLAGTSYNDTAVVNGTTYYYVVSATNAAGESTNSTQVSATPVAPPSAPATVSATPSNVVVSLSWSTSAGATGYNLKRATTNGGPYATIQTLAGTSYSDTVVTNGTTYYYVVSAFNAGGESANSAQASATPMAPPIAPTGLSAAGSNAVVSLLWSASSGATGYTVKRSTGSGGPYTTIQTLAGTSYNDTTVVNGTTYYYVVSASNAVGASANSTEVSATPVAPPVAPASLSAVGSNAMVSLSWSTSAGATGYNLKRSTTNGGPYTTVQTQAGTSYSDTAVVNGTTYYYVVSAFNAGGESSSSPQASATPVAPSAAPVGLSAVVSISMVGLSWNSTIGATSYNLKRSTASGGPYTTIQTQAGTNYNDTAVTNGTTYYYVVSAVNGGGESPNSSEVSAVLLHILPFAEDFEGLSLGDLAGQNGWGASNAVVQTAVAIGSNAVSLTSETGYIEQRFAGIETNVWTDFEVQPVFSQSDPASPNPLATSLFYFNTNGNLVVYDGTNSTIKTGVTITTGQWVRVTVRSDYLAKKWDIYINTNSVASALGFYNSATTRYAGFKISGGSASGVEVDNVRVDRSSLLGGDAALRLQLQLQLTNGNLSLSLMSQVNWSYRLWVSTNLLSPWWPLTTNAGTGAIIEFSPAIFTNGWPAGFLKVDGQEGGF